MKRVLPLLAGIVLAGCATTAPISKTLTIKDSGQPVTVTAGTTLIIELPANPTTGYDWTPVSSNGQVLKLVRSTYAQNAAAAGMVGVGGMDTFRVEALKPGKEVLEWNYVRPWEKNVPPAKTASFPVTVTP